MGNMLNVTRHRRRPAWPGFLVAMTLLVTVVVLVAPAVVEAFSKIQSGFQP